MTNDKLADRFKHYGIYYFQGMDDENPTAFTDEERKEVEAALRTPSSGFREEALEKAIRERCEFCHGVEGACEKWAEKCPIRKSAGFKEALIDALVVNHIYCAAHDTDPRKAVHDLLRVETQIALDPQVSSDAAALIERGFREGIEAAKQCALEYRDEADKGKHPDVDDPGHSLGQAFAANFIAKRIEKLQPGQSGGQAEVSYTENGAVRVDAEIGNQFFFLYKGNSQ